MVGAVARIKHQLELQRATRAEEERRAGRRQARAIRGQEQVRLQIIGVIAAGLVETGRAHFLAHFENHFQVAAQLAPCRLDGGGQRAQVDAVLALVVGGTATVPAIAIRAQLPGRTVLLPAAFLAVDHIAVAIHEHRHRVIRFDAACQQQRRCAFHRIGNLLRLEAQCGQRRCDLFAQVGGQFIGTRGVLAFGRQRDAALQVTLETARIEIFGGQANGGAAGHGGLRVNCHWRRF